MDNISSLYIHIPFCISKCAYCDFFSRAEGCVPDQYIDALCNEISFRIQKNQVSQIETIYVGGGTPSLLSDNQINKLFSHIKSITKLSSSAEITVEVNPDDVTQNLLMTFSECGVNRISCGIQSMNDSALKKACRRADSAANKKALSLLGSMWKGQVSVDLISGLPEDNEKSLLLSLEEVCNINPDHVSLYSLTIEEETPFGKLLSAGTLNYDFDKADALWLIGRDFLESKGYEWYEVSNFCRGGKVCHHNLAYWTHASYLGCGSGATGTVYANGGEGIRWTNTLNVGEYIECWERETSVDDKKPGLLQSEEIIDSATSEFEFFMMGLRKLRGFYSSEYERIFEKKLPQKFTALFNIWQNKKLCETRAAHNPADGIQYSMTREGMLFLNRFLEELC